jgi:hypothetical protein
MILLMLYILSVEVDTLVPACQNTTYCICNLSPQQTRREVIDFRPEEVKELNKQYQSKQLLRMSTTGSLRRAVTRDERDTVQAGMREMPLGSISLLSSSLRPLILY